MVVVPWASGVQDDANIDSLSKCSLPPIWPMPEMSASDVRQAAVRKFIDSENEENLYLLQDGTLIAEWIRTSLIRRVEQPSDLLVPLKNMAYCGEPHQGKVEYAQIPPKPKKVTVNVDLDELKNYYSMLNFQKESHAAGVTQFINYLEQNKTE